MSNDEMKEFKLGEYFLKGNIELDISQVIIDSNTSVPGRKTIQGALIYDGEEVHDKLMECYEDVITERLRGEVLISDYEVPFSCDVQVLSVQTTVQSEKFKGQIHIRSTGNVFFDYHSFNVEEVKEIHLILYGR